jgi:hypothetical protein
VLQGLAIQKGGQQDEQAQGKGSRQCRARLMGGL